MILQFEVVGRAQPGGSKRAFVVAGRARVVDANKNVGAWKDRVALAAAQAMAGRELYEGPLALSVWIELARPKRHFGVKGVRPSAPEFPAVKPDLTKYVRAIEDALKGIVWRDDAQVVEQHTCKVYGQRDRVLLTVRTATASAPGSADPARAAPADRTLRSASSLQPALPL